MRRRAFLAVAGSAALLAVGPTSVLAQCRPGVEGVHDTRGQIVGLGAGSFRIAHEEIPGHMRAMTMSFTPCPSIDTTGLAIGDRVAFRFTRGPGGRFLILELRRLDMAARPAG